MDDGIQVASGVEWGVARGSPSVEELVARIARLEVEVAKRTLRAYPGSPGCPRSPRRQV